jgi:hypothetical protein
MAEWSMAVVLKTSPNIERSVIPRRLYFPARFHLNMRKFWRDFADFGDLRARGNNRSPEFRP